MAQLKPGDLFEGKPVLPGAGIILTMNPPGPRYPGRREIDVATEREISQTIVSYPETTEVYEFLESSLMEKGIINADPREVSPYYAPGEELEEPRPVLDENGNETGLYITREAATLEEKPNAVDIEKKPVHGVLWRLAHAVSDIQKAFVYGNKLTIPVDAVRYTEVDGEIKITTNGTGNALTLERPTITLGEINSWMKGYGKRLEKGDSEYRTQTLGQWIALKARLYLDQINEEENPEDYKRVRAIFDHYHLLDGGDDISDLKVTTPLEIGYFSPTVPRPVTVESFAKGDFDAEGGERADEEIVPAREFEKRTVLLETGDGVVLREEPTSFFNGERDVELNVGDFLVMGIQRDMVQYVGKVAEGEKEGHLIFDVSEDGSLFRLVDPESPVTGIKDQVRMAKMGIILSKLDRVERAVCGKDGS